MPIERYESPSHSIRAISGMAMASAGTQHAAVIPARSFLGESLLLIFCLLALGVLEPKFGVESFRSITLQQAVDDGSANLANQLKWLALAGLATVAANRHFVRLWSLIVAAWPLMLVLTYCLLSAAWSDYPAVSLRRCFGLIVPAYCVCAALAAIDRPERVAWIVFAAFSAALLGNLLALPLSGSYDDLGYFRGVTGNKNILGGMATLGILSGFAVARFMIGFRLRTLWLLYLVGWSCLLVLSVSKTSIALAIGVPMLFYAFVFLAASFRISVASAAAIVVSLLLAIVGALLLDMSASDLVHLAWHDETFTGRVQLWNFILGKISRHWIVGLGFGSFWGVGDNSPNLYAPLDYIRLTNQAHDGYLDLMATVGVLGLLLVIGMLAHVLRTSEKFRFTQPWLFQFILFIISFALIHNAMESSLLVPFSIVWHFTLLACLVAVWAAQWERT